MKTVGENKIADRIKSREYGQRSGWRKRSASVWGKVSDGTLA